MITQKKVNDAYFVEDLTKRQFIIAIALVPLYCVGLLSYLYTKPIIYVVNLLFELSSEQQNLIAILFVSLLYVVVILLFSSFFKQALHSFRLQWARNILWIIIGFLVMFLVSNLLVHNLIAIVHTVTTSANEERLHVFLNAFPIIFTVNVIWIGPIIEELVYRVGVFRTLRRKSRVLAYAVSSFLFGFQHVYVAVIFQNNYSELWNIFTYLAVGLILAYAYDKRKNILIPIGIHMINNLLGILFYFSELS